MSKNRKTDRRTIYTISTIKAALLELEKDFNFEKINITQLCKKAEISRATFYLHYDSLNQVLDDIIDDALLFSSETEGTIVDVLDIVKSGNIQMLKKDESILPACQRIANSELYHDLFMDATISEYIINKIFKHEYNDVVFPLMKYSNISEFEAKIIFKFILNGSFAINRTLNWEKNENWFNVQLLLSQFINGGMSNLKKI